MEKKKRRRMLFVLWFIFLFMVAGISYVSFQSGEDAKELGKETIAQLTKANYHRGFVTQEQIDKVTYIIRQSGRAIAFLLLGIVGTVTIYATFSRCNWFIRAGIALSVLGAIACLTEKLKVFIPTRHYSFEEMLISLAAVGAGFLSVMLLMLLGKALRGVSRPKATGNYL